LPATSHDVAKAAGVSQSTVSRALRGMPGIAKETLERVQKAAAELAYVASEAGRALSTRQTRTIGIVAAELTNPFYPELVEPMRAELQRLGYRALLIPDSSEAPLETERLADGTLDGVVITTACVTSHLPEFLTARHIPFVLVNREVDGVSADTCVVDNITGAREAADLLAQLGHKRIGAIFGPQDTSTGRDRELGLRQGLASHQIHLQPSLVRHGPFSYETGFAHTQSLLASKSRPTAIFCGNDVIALGACNAATASGFALGQDITIIGFDDIAMAAWNMFQITTFRCDRREMAVKAVEMLMNRIAEPDRPPERHLLLPKLVLRSTHAKPN